MYAFITDGLEPAKREEIDVLLKGKGTSKTKAKRERAAVDSVIGFMR